MYLRYAINIMLKFIVNITSDKAYENKEWDRGYKEDDPLEAMILIVLH